MTIILKGAWDYAVWRSANHEKGKVGKLKIWIWLILREYLSTFCFQIWRPTRDGDLFWDPRVPAEAKGGIWEVEHWKYFEEDLKRSATFRTFGNLGEKGGKRLRRRFVGFCPKMAVMTWILSCVKIHKLSYSLLLVFYFFLLMPLPLTLTN